MTVEHVLQELDAIAAFTDGHAGTRIRALRSRLHAEGLQLMGESPGASVRRAVYDLHKLSAFPGMDAIRTLEKVAAKHDTQPTETDQ